MLALNNKQLFRLCLEIDIQQARQSLYAELGVPAPSYTYKDEQGEFEQTFQNQLITLLNMLFKLQQQCGINSSALRLFYLDFYPQAQDLSRFVGQSNAFFEELKHMLETIVIQLNARQASSDIKPLLNEFLTHLSVCGPGIYNHIVSMERRLSSQETLDYWLAELRTSIADRFTEQHIHNKAIPAGDSIHVHIGYSQRALHQGFNLLDTKRIAAINDQFFSGLAKIEQEDIDKFITFFISEYLSAEAIINCITHRVSSLLHKTQKHLLKDSDTPGWILATPGNTSQLNQVVSNILKQLSLTGTVEPHAFIELNDEQTHLRLRQINQHEIATYVLLGLTQAKVFENKNIQTNPITPTINLHRTQIEKHWVYWLSTSVRIDEHSHIRYILPREFLEQHQVAIPDQSVENTYQTVLAQLPYASIMAFITVHRRFPRGLTLEQLFNQVNNLDEWLALATALSDLPEIKPWLKIISTQKKLVHCFMQSLSPETFLNNLNRIKPYLWPNFALNYQAPQSQFPEYTLALCMANSRQGTAYLVELHKKSAQPLISNTTLNYVIQQGSKRGLSVAYALSCTAPQLLSYHNHFLSSQLSLDMLMSCPTQTNKNKLPLIHCLAINERAAQCLLANDGALLALIDSELLNKKINRGTVEQPIIITLALLLASHLTGIRCLEHHQGALLKQLNTETINYIVEHGPQQGKSFISLLWETTEGECLFIDHAQQLMPKLNKTLLKTPLVSGHYQDVPFIASLSINSACEYYLNHHQTPLYPKVDKELLSTPFSYKGSTQLTLAFFLAGSASGIECLTKDNHRLLSMLTQSELNKTIAAGEYKDQSIASQLFKSFEGRGLLRANNYALAMFARPRPPMPANGDLLPEANGQGPGAGV